MITTVDDIAKRFSLSPYQIYMLKQNGYRYDLDKIKKLGEAVYAPHRCKIPDGIGDYIEKLLLGPRADIIGTDRMIIAGERGVSAKKLVDRQY